MLAINIGGQGGVRSGFPVSGTSSRYRHRPLGSLRDATPAPRESHTWVATLSTPRAQRDAPRPTGTGTAARSWQASAPLPSAQTNCRCIGAARLQTESTQILD